MMFVIVSVVELNYSDQVSRKHFQIYKPIIAKKRYQDGTLYPGKALGKLTAKYQHNHWKFHSNLYLQSHQRQQLLIEKKVSLSNSTF